MKIRIRTDARKPLLFALILAGCGGDITNVHTDRVFTLVGTLGAERWTSVEVPGSTETRPGTTLPAFLVCGMETGDSHAKAAVVVDRGTLTLHGDGTSKLELTTGTWWRVGGLMGSSGQTIAEFGRWTEPTPGTINLSGFTTIAFNAPLHYTEIGSGLTEMTFACPGASTTGSLTPQLVFSRTS
jgi:hypothetical protein